MASETFSKRYSRTTFIVLCGLFAAISAICSQISIPLGFTPIPVNLGTLAVFLTGGLLGKKYGTISMTVYVLLGAAGVPVFAGLRGGISVLAGPTGGYIIGYIAAVFIIGILCDIPEKRRVKRADQGAYSCAAGQNSHSRTGAAAEALLYALAMLCGLLICYVLGTAWFMISSGTGLGAAMLSCVVPFLPGDALKILAAAILVKKLRPLLR